MPNLAIILIVVGAGAWILLYSGSGTQPSDRSGDERAHVHRARTYTAALNPPAEPLPWCDESCRKLRDEHRSKLEEELENVPSGLCTARFYAINATSKRLALEAIDECKLNHAMPRIDPDYVPRTVAQDRSKAFNKMFSEKAEQAIWVLSLMWFSQHRP